MKERFGIKTKLAGLALASSAVFACSESSRDTNKAEVTAAPTQCAEDFSDFEIPFQTDHEGNAVVRINTIYLDNDPCFVNKKLDHSCGIPLVVDKDGVAVTLESRANSQLTIGFDLSLITGPDGSLYFINLPVTKSQHYFGMSLPGKTIPLGSLIRTSATTAFFAPYEKRIFKVEGCKQQETKTTPNV